MTVAEPRVRDTKMCVARCESDLVSEREANTGMEQWTSTGMKELANDERAFALV